MGSLMLPLDIVSVGVSLPALAAKELARNEAMKPLSTSSKYVRAQVLNQALALAKVKGQTYFKKP